MWTIIRLQWYNCLKVFENYRKDGQFHETTDDFRSISKAGVHLWEYETERKCGTVRGDMQGDRSGIFWTGCKAKQPCFWQREKCGIFRRRPYGSGVPGSGVRREVCLCDLFSGAPWVSGAGVLYQDDGVWWEQGSGREPVPSFPGTGKEKISSCSFVPSGLFRSRRERFESSPCQGNYRTCGQNWDAGGAWVCAGRLCYAL